MTLKQFARVTGWPLKELMNTPAREFVEILALMGLKLGFVPRKAEQDE